MEDEDAANSMLATHDTEASGKCSSGRSEERLVKNETSPTEGPDPSLGSLTSLKGDDSCMNSESLSDWSALERALESKECQIARLEAQLASNVAQVDVWRGEVRERKEQEKEMRRTLDHYERTINEMIAVAPTSTSTSNDEASKELSQSKLDLAAAEKAFADVHRKYERSKEVLEGLKHNEVVYNEAIKELKERLEKQERRFQLLRSHAEETLEKANEEIQRIKMATDTEVARLEAIVKKTELNVARLERSVQQKEAENQELTDICDELIAKIGQ